MKFRNIFMIFSGLVAMVIMATFSHNDKKLSIKNNANQIKLKEK